MQPVEIKATVKLNLTAEQWNLITFQDPSGAEKAAKDINKRVALALNEGDTEAAYKVLDEYSTKYGATDSEPLWVLRKIAQKMNLIEEV